MSTSPVRWTPVRAGCIYAGGSYRTADELNAKVVLLALYEGWIVHGLDEVTQEELRTLAEKTDGWLDDSDDSQWLSESALSAQDWMDDYLAPEGYVFTFDDGFYLHDEGCEDGIF